MFFGSLIIIPMIYSSHTLEPISSFKLLNQSQHTFIVAFFPIEFLHFRIRSYFSHRRAGSPKILDRRVCFIRLKFEELFFCVLGLVFEIQKKMSIWIFSCVLLSDSSTTNNPSFPSILLPIVSFQNIGYLFRFNFFFVDVIALNIWLASRYSQPKSKLVSQRMSVTVSGLYSLVEARSKQDRILSTS